MKKIFIVIMSFLLIIICLSGCSNDSKVDNDVLNITENTFLTQVTDIYNNPTLYMGKTLKIEGMFMADTHTGHSHYYIYRNIPVYDSDHDHNHNQKIGFEFTYTDNLPKDNDWIEITGKLHNYTENGHNTLRVEASSVKIIDKQDAEISGDQDVVIHDEGVKKDEHFN